MGLHKTHKKIYVEPLCVGKAACHGAITSSFILRNKAAVFTVLKESNGFSASTITHTLQAPPHLSSTGPSTSGEAGQGLHPAFQGAPHRDGKPSHGCGMKGVGVTVLTCGVCQGVQGAGDAWDG